AVDLADAAVESPPADGEARVGMGMGADKLHDRLDVGLPSPLARAEVKLHGHSSSLRAAGTGRSTRPPRRSCGARRPTSCQGLRGEPAVSRRIPPATGLN